MSSTSPDARTLIIGVLVLTSMAVAINDAIILAGLLTFTLVALAVANISWMGLLRRLKRYRWLIIILAVAQSLTNSYGHILLEWRGYVLISSGGLLAAVAVMLRITIILAAVQFFSRKNYQQMVTGMVQLKMPYELAYMVLLGLRFIPVFIEEFRGSLTAIALRGVDLKRIPWRNKFRVYSYIFMPTVAGAIVRARRISIAMEARAFRAHKERTWLDWPRLTPADWGTIIGILVIGGSTLLAYWRGII